MAMEERDRIDIIATLHDRFNRPADEIIRKMERMERQADETGDQIDDLEDSLDKESRTTRENTKYLDENTKSRARHGDAIDGQDRSISRSTRNVRANTDAVRESIVPVNKASQAHRDAAKATQDLSDASRDAHEAVSDSNDGMRTSQRVINARTRAVGRARDSMGRFTATVEGANETLRNNTRRTQENTKSREESTRQTDRDSKSWTKWDAKIRKITGSIGARFRPIGAFFQNYFKILGAFRALLFSDIGAMIPQLITGLVALGAAANALLGPFGRLLGTLGQIAPLMAAFFQTQTVVKMAIGGVSDALKVLNDETATLADLNKAQKELGDNTWNMAKAVKQLGEDFQPLKKEVRETFLEGMVPALGSLVDTYFPLLRKELTNTAAIMNGELREGMKALQTDEKQQTIANVMERSSVASGLFVDIMWSLLDVFIELADAAGPAFLETLEAIDGRLDQFSGWVRDNKGELTDFFLRANDTAGAFFQGLGNIMLGLYGISKAAEPLTEFLYGGDRLESWAERMNDPAAQEEMRKGYEDMIPNLEAIGNLIGSVIEGAKEIATSEFFAPLINDLADSGIPMIVEYIKELDATVGPPLLRISEAFNSVEPDVLTSVLAPLGDALGALAWALELVAPLFNALPEPMQKTVMYGIGLTAMGLPGFFFLLLMPLKFVIQNFETLSKLFEKLKNSKLGKFLGGLAGKLKAFFKPIGEFIGKTLGKIGGGGLIARIFGKIGGKAILGVLGPVGVVIGILWLLWDVLSYLWNNVEPFRNFMIGVWEWIVQAWSASIDWIVNTAVPWIVGAFQAIWQKIQEIGQALVGFYNQWIKPVIDAFIWLGKVIFVSIATIFVLIGQMIGWAWNTLLAPFLAWLWNGFGVGVQGVFSIIGAAAGWLWEKMKLAWHGIVAGAQWLWGALQAVAHAIVGAFVWLYGRVAAVFAWIRDNVIAPVVNWFIGWVSPLIRGVISALVGAFVWLRDRVTSVFRWIQDVAVRPATNWFMNWVWPTIKNVLTWLGDRFSWLRDRIGNVWDAIKSKISTVYNEKIKPIFDKFKEAVNALKESFEVAKKSIGKAWDSIKEKAKKPIGFVIDKVYNEGIRPVWNRLAKAVDLDTRLGEVKWASKGYATGGYTGPGSKHQWAGDVHADEFVIRKESQRSLRRAAPGYLDALNKYGAKALAGAGYASGGWVKPFVGSYGQNSGYGMRGGRMHAGVDYPTPSGTAMTAVSAGSIVGRSSGGPAGNKLSLATDMKGIVAGYHHLSRFVAAMGQQVSKGQVIGYSGNTGRSTGPHLHFSIKKDGRYVNPNPYLQGSGSAGTGEGGGGFGWVNPFEGMLTRFLDKLPGAGGFKDIASKATTTMVNKAKDYAWKHLNPMDNIQDMASDAWDGIKGVGASLSTSRWAGVAKKALEHTGQWSQSNHQALMRRMRQESGGNASAINNWDSNARRGTPSKGLMQVIQPTFNAYRDRSLSSNIYDPMANIVASINYAKSRYGSLASAYNRRGGYFSGGLVTPIDHMRFMGGPVETWGNTLVGEFGPEIFMPSIGEPSILGMTGPEMVSFDREGSILPHQAVAALSTVGEGGVATMERPSEGDHYDINVVVNGDGNEADIKRAVMQAMAEVERKRKERR